MGVELFAGMGVADYAGAVGWYERLFGGPAAFAASDTESVWRVGEHGWVYVVLRPEHAGHGMLTLLVPDLDAHVAALAARGLEPAERETYGDGVRKIIYRDPDGNEIGYGASPG